MAPDTKKVNPKVAQRPTLRSNVRKTVVGLSASLLWECELGTRKGMGQAVLGAESEGLRRGLDG